MQINFSKYHGAGNDFILMDKRENNISLSKDQIATICKRRYGVGADGFMTLENSDSHDFLMKYYNSDGNEGSMCGNGGRCIIAFAKDLGIIDKQATFMAPDGVHKAAINSSNNSSHDISLNMNDVKEVNRNKNIFFLDTGSPHHIEFVEDLSEIDIDNKGREIRYWDKYKANNGTNVNFIETNSSIIRIRTYERGVECETHACGTGATAAAIAFAIKENIYDKEIKLQALGGILRVSFEYTNNIFTNIVLSGPAKRVFEGSYSFKSI